MLFSFETGDLRAVVKNTFVHIEKAEDAFIEIGYPRQRRYSDVFDVRHSAQHCKLFENEAASSDVDDVTENKSEVLSTFANDAFENETSDVTEVDNKPNADLDSLRVVIKRTFIHFELVDEDCNEAGLLRRKSRRRLTDILHARDADAQSYKHAIQESMSYRSQHQVVSPDARVNYEDCTPHSDAESSADSRDSNDCKVNGAISMGSALHFQGLCRPCVWFWRPETCNKGAACEYCHLCDEEALARLADTKKAIKKQKKRMNKHRRR
jgi:hypothetical protein